ncbi:MAG: acyltransferase family protein [Eggerthellaceae bacterium]|nr:acyltransferase family protein [Eggerthellaceae bacterium]
MKRIPYLDALRIISIFAIVLLHVAGSYWYNLDVASPDWVIVNAYDCLPRWGVPVFVMISGALFLDPGRPQPIRKLWTHNIPHVAVITLFWGIVYALLYNTPADLSPASLAAFAKSAVFGPQHLWFMFMLIGLYILAPVLRCITRDAAATRYFLGLGLVLNIAVPALTLANAPDTVEEFLDLFMLQMPMGYPFFFVLGSYLATNDITKGVRYVTYGLGVWSIICQTAGSMLSSQAAGSANNAYIASTCFVIFSSAAVFLLAKHGFARMKDGSDLTKGIAALAPCTLGTYLIHIIVLKTLMAAGLSGLMFGPLVGVPLLTVIVTALSYLIAWMLKQIPFVGRYLV